jgi:TRAP-type C4-dicarboxylate transport system permease small subunit
MKTVLILIVEFLARVFNRIGYLLGILLIFLMIVTLAAAVVSRYIFNSPIFWTDEFARIVLIWTIFVGAALALKKGSVIEHISMDFLVEKFPAAGRRIVDRLILIIDLLFCIAVLAIGWIFISKTYRIITAALEVSKAVIYSALPLFCIMAISFLLERLVTGSEDDEKRTQR